MIISESVNRRGEIINVSDIAPYSHLKVDVKCDFCSDIKSIQMLQHTLSCKKDGKYYCNKCKWIKSKKTCLDKYGFENASSAEIIKNKRKLSNIDSYGVENVFQSQEIKNRIMDYWLANFGVENGAQTKHIKDKIKKTFNEKYGEDHFMKNTLAYDKYLKSSLKIIKFKGSEIYYQGSYELDFLEKYYEKVKIENGIGIRYQFENTNHSYMPDFYLPDYNLIVEIKSTYTYNLHLSKNLLKQEYSIISGHNFVFIIDKNYEEFKKIISKNEK